MEFVMWWLILLSFTVGVGGLGAFYFVWWTLWRNKQLTMLLVEHYQNQEDEEPIK